MRRYLFLLSLVVVGMYLVISWYFSSQIVVYNPPSERSEEWRSVWEPEWDVEITETVEIQSGENRLVADIYDNPEDADCGVIIVHGLGGERSIARVYGSIFYELQCDILAYDFAPATNDVLLTYGFSEKNDLENVLLWFADYVDIPTTSIGIIGQSYGAATALQMLPQQSDVAWIIADSSYSSMPEIVNHQAYEQFGDWIGLFVPSALMFSEMRGDFFADDVSPEASVRDVDVPILIVHSQQDGYTPADHSQAIYDAANPDTTELVITDWGADHAQSVIVDKEAYTQIVYDFLAELVPDFGNQE